MKDKIGFISKLEMFELDDSGNKINKILTKNFMKNTRKEVYKAIDTEREYQDSFISNPENERSDGRNHPVGDFIVMLQHYQGELVKEWTLNAGDDKSLDVMRKIAGICVHCMEKHGAIERKV